jgi:hypothetical protein
MNILFSTLSAAYIAGIFLFADSPMVSDVATFNPYSLLHIPLYAMLTFLLIVSFSPQRKRFLNPTNSTNPTNSINSSDSRNLRIAGIIALVVAIADEIHQVYIPNRNASIIDVLLDMIGIGLCVLVTRRFRFMSALRNSGPPKRLS